MEPSRTRALQRLVLAFDPVLVVAAMAAAAGLHAGLRHWVHFLRTPPSFDQYAVLPLIAVPLFVGLNATFGLHRWIDRGWGRSELIAALLKIHVVAFASLAMLLFITQSVINRSLTALFLGASFTLLYLERRLLGAWLRYQHQRGIGRERLLLVGGQGMGLDAFIAQAHKASLPPHVVGVLSSEPPRDPDLRHLGDLGELPQVLHLEAVDHVVFFPPFHRPAEASAALECTEMLGIPASFYIDAPARPSTPPRVRTLLDQPFISFEPSPKLAEALALKHVLDATIAALLLLLLSPLLLLISLAIRISMGRPILFAQSRAGLQGRLFRMYKFRTMVPDAEHQREALTAHNEMSGPVFKLARDPRVTRLGALLRRTSLDELPQLFNVLLGEMSLVGPRPLPAKEQERISGWHRRRLSMRPGITGLWQVSGRNDVDFEEWMRLDLEYVDRWSLWLDLALLARTVPAVLFAKGAR